VDLLYSCSGQLLTEEVDAILVELEYMIDRLDLPKKNAKRLFTLAVEGLQNIERHGLDHPEFSGVSFVLLYKREQQFVLVFGNLIDDRTKRLLEYHLQRIEGLGKEELKEMLIRQLDRGELTEKGGGGLGILTLALKSSGKVKAVFTPLEEGVFYLFSMRVSVDEY